MFTELSVRATLENAELLVLPYGSAVPAIEWDVIEHYVHAGGNLLVIGGQPLYVPVSAHEGAFRPDRPQAPARVRSTFGIRGNSGCAAAETDSKDTFSGDRILLAYYGENYVSLLPGENRTVTVEFPQLGQKPMVELRGWNLDSQTAELRGRAAANQLMWSSTTKNVGCQSR